MRAAPFAALSVALLAALAFAVPGISAERDVAGPEPLCYHVSSYHAGFAWSDGIERGLGEGLEGHCRVETFHLDTKRFLEPAQMRAAAEAAHRRMLEIEPDIVIVSDDNAVRHFVEPRLLGTDMPVVFCGVNWTVEEYRLPDPNVTGMIEVSPMDALLELGREITDGGERVVYLTVDTLSGAQGQRAVARAGEGARRFQVRIGARRQRRRLAGRLRARAGALLRPAR